MDTNASDAGTAALKGVRRAAIWTIIVSLVIAAGIGIATIVSGEFGEIQSKVLLTTLAVAAFAILALCHLAIITRDVRIVGWIGIGTSVLAFASAATLIWWDWNDNGYGGPGSVYMTITKVFTVSTLAAVSFAHANLMLLLASTPIRWMLCRSSSTRASRATRCSWRTPASSTPTTRRSSARCRSPPSTGS